MHPRRHEKRKATIRTREARRTGPTSRRVSLARGKRIRPCFPPTRHAIDAWRLEVEIRPPAHRRSRMSVSSLFERALTIGGP